MDENKIYEQVWEDAVQYCYDWFFREEKWADEYRKIMEMPLGMEKAEAKYKFWKVYEEEVSEDYRENGCVVVEDEELLENTLFEIDFEMEYVIDQVRQEVEWDIKEEKEQAEKKRRAHEDMLRRMYPECFDITPDTKKKNTELIEYLIEYIKEDFDAVEDYEMAKKLLLMAMNKEFKAGEFDIIPKQKNIKKIKYVIFRIARAKLLFGGNFDRKKLVLFLQKYFINCKDSTEEYIYKHLSDAPEGTKDDFDNYFSDFYK